VELVRSLAAPAGALSTAATPRAEIAGQTRPVVRAHPARALRWRESVALGDLLEIDVVLPPELADEDLVRVDAWVYSGSQAAEGEGLRALRLGAPRRSMLRAAPLILGRRGDRLRGVARIPVPEALQGGEGRLTVMARALPAPVAEPYEIGPVDLREGDRLLFGYGVEESAWHPDWPPVLFRASLVGAGGRRTTLFERRIDPGRDERDRRWFDAAIDLSAHAGESARILFEQQALVDGQSVVVPGSFPLLSNPRMLRARLRPAAERPNVVLVSLDTLRARSVGAYGYARDTTPSLDRRVAAAGAIVRSAVAPVPFTPPSHMTMLTGLEPCAHGVLDRHGVLAAERVTLPEVLQAEGYATAAFTENAYVVAGAGFSRGFDVYAEKRDEESASPGFASETFASAKRWLAKRPPVPFFLFIHTYQVHDPYVPPRGYAALFAGDGQGAVVPAAHRANLDDYDREIRHTDDVLADFLDTLDSHGLAENTVLVITSDHGEGFGEHFWGGHGASIHDEALLVPLIVRAPGRIAPGVVVEPQVGLLDLVPTLLELADVAIPAEVMGRSFASLLTGAAPAFTPRPLQVSGLEVEGVRSDRYKYMRFAPSRKARAAGKLAPPKERLFDLVADPEERKNLRSERPQLLAEARAALDEHAAVCAQWRDAHPVSAAPERAKDRDPTWMFHRDDIDEKLRSLGYIE